MHIQHRTMLPTPQASNMLCFGLKLGTFMYIYIYICLYFHLYRRAYMYNKSHYHCMIDPTGSHQFFPSSSSRGVQQNVIRALSVIIHVPNKVQDRLVYRVPFSNITPAVPLLLEHCNRYLTTRFGYKFCTKQIKIIEIISFQLTKKSWVWISPLQFGSWLTHRSLDFVYPGHPGVLDVMVNSLTLWSRLTVWTDWPSENKLSGHTHTHTNTHAHTCEFTLCGKCVNDFPGVLALVDCAK